MTFNTMMFISIHIFLYTVEPLCATTAWLAQLGEHRSADREVTGSKPGRTNTQGLNLKN